MDIAVPSRLSPWLLTKRLPFRARLLSREREREWPEQTGRRPALKRFRPPGSFCRTLRKIPSGIPNARSVARPIFAKSAILGDEWSLISDKILRTSLKIDTNAPKMGGRESLNASRKSASVRRDVSGIAGNSILIERSIKSPSETTLLMLVRITGRTTFTRTSSSSVYNFLTRSPPPVDRRQIISDKDEGSFRRLSKHKTDVFLAAIIKSRSEFEGGWRGTVLGSTSDRSTLAVVYFADP